MVLGLKDQYEHFLHFGAYSKTNYSKVFKFGIGNDLGIS